MGPLLKAVHKDPNLIPRTTTLEIIVVLWSCEEPGAATAATVLWRQINPLFTWFYRQFNTWNIICVVNSKWRIHYTSDDPFNIWGVIGAILMCTPDNFFQRFIINGSEFRKCRWEWLKRVDQYYEIMEKKNKSLAASVEWVSKQRVF